MTLEALPFLNGKFVPSETTNGSFILSFMEFALANFSLFKDESAAITGSPAETAALALPPGAAHTSITGPSPQFPYCVKRSDTS